MRGPEQDDDEMPRSSILELVAAAADVDSSGVAWALVWQTALTALSHPEALAAQRKKDHHVASNERTLPQTRPAPAVPPAIPASAVIKQRWPEPEELRLPDVSRSNSASGSRNAQVKRPKPASKHAGPLLPKVGRREQYGMKRQSLEKEKPAPDDDDRASPAKTSGGRTDRRVSQQRGAVLRAERQASKQGRGKGFRPVRDGARPADADGEAVLIRHLLDDVSRQKKEKLLEMLLDIESDLAESPIQGQLPRRVNPGPLAGARR
ncbi:hypothetical protein M885DRAFT_530626 [Pelagophyceae sp. CCMP2097]|nr:hypothetical protein M885DRAFT_530626 [Pelagophyceae sp. CCMP2097]